MALFVFGCSRCRLTASSSQKKRMVEITVAEGRFISATEYSTQPYRLMIPPKCSSQLNPYNQCGLVLIIISVQPAQEGEEQEVVKY